MPLFHEVSGDEFHKLVDGGWTWRDIEENYRQPDWCQYPDALQGVMGCLSLVNLRIKSVRQCAACEFCSTPVVTGIFEQTVWGWRPWCG